MRGRKYDLKGNRYDEVSPGVWRGADGRLFPGVEGRNGLHTPNGTILTTENPSGGMPLSPLMVVGMSLVVGFVFAILMMFGSNLLFKYDPPGDLLIAAGGGAGVLFMLKFFRGYTADPLVAGAVALYVGVAGGMAGDFIVGISGAEELGRLLDLVVLIAAAAVLWVLSAKYWRWGRILKSLLFGVAAYAAAAFLVIWGVLPASPVIPPFAGVAAFAVAYALEGRRLPPAAGAAREEPDVRFVRKVIWGGGFMSPMRGEIAVDEDVRQMIIDAGEDFRVCTACRGPALVPVSVKPPKGTDLKIDVGGNTLYVSSVQAMYIDRVTMDMYYDEDEVNSCAAFYAYGSACGVRRR